ncbi:hypothetical protein JCM10449v2_000393 [Rhodotorula kratochvilovae]
MQPGRVHDAAALAHLHAQSVAHTHSHPRAAPSAAAHPAAAPPPPPHRQPVAPPRASPGLRAPTPASVHSQARPSHTQAQALVQYAAPGPVQHAWGGGARAQAQGQTDPRSWSVEQLHKKRSLILDFTRDLAQRGAFDIELKLQFTFVEPVLRAALLPVNKKMLDEVYGDMMLLPNCTANNYVTAFELWAAWASINDIPAFPICGSLVAYFLLDRILDISDRARTVALLDLYRNTTTPVFSTLGGCPREHVGVNFGPEEWARWDLYVGQAAWPLLQWRALRELCGIPEMGPPPPLQPPGMPAPLTRDPIPIRPRSQPQPALPAPGATSNAQQRWQQHQPYTAPPPRPPTLPNAPQAVQTLPNGARVINVRRTSAPNISFVAEQPHAEPPVHAPAVSPAPTAGQQHAALRASAPASSGRPPSAAGLQQSPVASASTATSTSAPAGRAALPASLVTAAAPLLHRRSKSSGAVAASSSSSAAHAAHAAPAAAPNAAPAPSFSPARRRIIDVSATVAGWEACFGEGETSGSVRAEKGAVELREEEARARSASAAPVAMASAKGKGKEREKEVSSPAGGETAPMPLPLQRAADKLHRAAEARRQKSTTQARAPPVVPLPGSGAPQASGSAAQGAQAAAWAADQMVAARAHAAAVAAALASNGAPGQPPGAGPAPVFMHYVPPAVAAVAQQQQFVPAAPPALPPKKKRRTSSKNATVTLGSLDDEAEETEFWMAAAEAERAIENYAKAKTAALLSARARGSTASTMSDAAAALASIRASPWVNGRPHVAPPQLVVTKAVGPYGDYLPVLPDVPAPTRAPHRMSLMRDPLNVLLPFPTRLPPPPAAVRLTSAPFDFPADASTTVQLTPQQFVHHADALRPYEDSRRAKTWEYAQSLAHFVDSEVAKRAERDGVPPPAGDERERARQAALAATLRKSFRESKIDRALPDVVEPAARKQARKQLKKLRKAERKAKEAREGGAAGAKDKGKGKGVLELVDSDAERAGGARDPAAMDVDGGAAKDAPATGPARDHSSTQPEEAESVDARKSRTPTPAPAAASPAAQPQPANAPRATSASAPPAPAIQPITGSTNSPRLSSSLATTPAAGAAFPPRPSLAATASVVSAPAVPGVRPRSNSHGLMRRRPSVSGPGIHPLAQLYTTAPSSMRQMMRGKASELRGVPNDPVALALATARLTSPALRSEAVLAGSARGSPRFGAGTPLAMDSPPLVPIPLKGVVGPRADRDVEMSDGAPRAGTAEPAAQRVTSALGMSIESPAMSTVAREPVAARSSAQANGSRKDAASSAAPAAAAPPAATAPPPASVGSSVVSTLSSVARATAGAVAAAARAILPGETTASANATSSALSSAESSRAATPSGIIFPAAGPGVEATAPTALVGAGPGKGRGPRHCQHCGSSECQGRWRPHLCREQPARAPVSTGSGGSNGKGKGKGKEVPSAPRSRVGSPALVPAKRPADAERRPHVLHSVRRDWLAVSEPLKPFSVPVKRVRVLPPTGQI